MKKIDVNKSLIFSRKVEDLKNSLDYLYQGGYCSNSEDFSVYEEGNLDGVHASNFMVRPYELTCNGCNKFFSYFIPKSKVVFIEKKTLRPFKSIDEFFKVTSFNIGEIVQIKRVADCPYEEKNILNGFRVYTDDKFPRPDVIFGSRARTLGELFKYYEYYKNGKWLPFGVEE